MLTVIMFELTKHEMNINGKHIDVYYVFKQIWYISIVNYNCLGASDLILMRHLFMVLSSSVSRSFLDTESDWACDIESPGSKSGVCNLCSFW